MMKCNKHYSKINFNNDNVGSDWKGGSLLNFLIIEIYQYDF